MCGAEFRALFFRPSGADLAVPASRVRDIVRGKRAISADTALRLGIYFRLHPQFWVNL